MYTHTSINIHSHISKYTTYINTCIRPYLYIYSQTQTVYVYVCTNKYTYHLKAMISYSVM